MSRKLGMKWWEVVVAVIVMSVYAVALAVFFGLFFLGVWVGWIGLESNGF